MFLFGLGTPELSSTKVKHFVLKIKEKTSFSISNGYFDLVRMSFGLEKTTTNFQRMMKYVLMKHINKICVVYMELILIFSTSLHGPHENWEKL